MAVDAVIVDVSGSGVGIFRRLRSTLDAIAVRGEQTDQHWRVDAHTEFRKSPVWARCPGRFLGRRLVGSLNFGTISSIAA